MKIKIRRWVWKKVAHVQSISPLETPERMFHRASSLAESQFTFEEKVV